MPFRLMNDFTATLSFQIASEHFPSNYTLVAKESETNVSFGSTTALRHLASGI